MGMWNMKNRGDMQKDITKHIDLIDRCVEMSDNPEHLTGLLQAKSTALLALTQTLPKEK
ncbi:hypothetical protein D3C75_135640 [compost metagenome]